MEIGIGNTGRTLRLIDLALRLSEGEAVRYAAIDLFEARASDLTKLPLKEAHRLLKTTAVQSQLIPGEPAMALARCANSLPEVDLLIIASEQLDAALEGAWFYLPRMLHQGSLVLREEHDAETNQRKFRRLELAEIRQRAGRNRRRAA